MKKHIPNAITCCNLLCGCMATFLAFRGAIQTGPYLLLWAFCFIIGGAVFDFFDGFVARLLGVSSPIGKELDSLADVITFGLAPAAVVFALLRWLVPEGWGNVAYVAFLIAAFSALRLAKFNLDTRQTMGFIGLPTPANALFWSGLALTLMQNRELCEENGKAVTFLLLIGILVSCWLLICELPMFALKFHDYKWRSNRLRYGFIIVSAAIIVAVVIAKWWAGLPLIVVLYVMTSLFSQLFKK